MRSINKSLVLVFVTFTSFASTSAQAQLPQKALDAYVKAYNQMGKNAAVMFAQENTRASTKSKEFTAWIDAQCKILDAKSKWITAVAEVNSTNAKTRLTLQEVQGKALDNNLKVAKTFYDKRTLYAGYQGLNTKKRPTSEAITRYSQTSVQQKRPDRFQLSSFNAKITWPRVLLDDAFFNERISLGSLFAQRRSAQQDSIEDTSHKAQELIEQMSKKLRSKIRNMSPAEYIATRKFLESLAYEATLAPRVGGLASN